MINNLMYISNGLIIVSFVGYLFLILINRKSGDDKSNGFNATKNILREYDSINIIENTSYLTFYNIKRRVIKIASRCYYGNSISDIGLSLLEAGISVADNGKNRFINFLRYIISNLKLLYILPIIALFFNSISYNIIEAKIGIVLLVIFSFIMYMLINIKIDASFWLSNNLKRVKDINKDKYVKIIDFINKIILFDKFILIGELVIIIRYIIIILNDIY